ncbi:GNAT family N-acetyltransferase [Thermoleophilia bacterium SCSIO 60948]|nr:GNAT family N-acetyltransferase [Thermoleophilia bacterium SCSIO 60948]
MAEAIDRRVGGRRATDPGARPSGERREDYERMRSSLLALWADLAEFSEGASAGPLDGACAARFPDPRGAVFNNALLDRGCSDPAATVDCLRGHYSDGGVSDYAIWAHESEAPSLEAIEAAGLERSEATRAMLVHLDRLPPKRRGSRGKLSIGTTLAPGEALELNALSLDTLDAWPDDATWYLALEDEELVSCALAHDLDGDRSISFVATAEGHRRKGAASRVLGRMLADALASGCRSASLHATPAAEGIYRRAGFTDLGLLIEYRPARG